VTSTTQTDAARPAIPQMIFVNWLSSDLGRARAFYAALGLSSDDRFCGPDTLLVNVSDAIHLMLMSRPQFEALSPQPVAPEGTVSALVSLSRASREDVDAFMAAGLAHGGTDNGDVHEQGDFMYGRSITDPDGNGIGVMWMDVDRAMKAWGMAA
jgi:predicted lactoylglutathione lyase